MRERLKFLLCFMVFTALFLLTIKVQAAGLNIKYDGRTVSYTDTQVTYTWNGEEITSDYPGIIIDGVSLAPMAEIFSKSGMGITYVYDRSEKTVDLFYEDQEINFSLGSPIAVVNGEIRTLALAPRIIEFTETGTRKVYIPARFVAESFGFRYVWTSGTGIAAISGVPGSTGNAGSSGNTAGTGDSTSTNKPADNAETLKIRYNGKDYTYEGQKIQVYAGTISCTTANKYGLMIGDTLMVPAKTVFAGKGIGGTYKYDSTTKTILLEKYGVTIIMKLNSTDADINGQKITLSAAPRQIKNYETGVTQIYIPLLPVAEAMGYGYQVEVDGSRVDLTEPYQILYNGKWILPSVKGTVTFDGNEVDVAPAYSFITTNTAMVHARAVFQKGLGCSFEYDKGTKTLTIGYGDHVLTLQVGSTAAFLDGGEVTLPVAPSSVKYGNSGSYVMVPGRFVTESLGLKYDWDSTNSISVITTPETVTKPEVGTVVPSIDANLFQWNSAASYENYLAEIRTKGITTGTITGRTQDAENPSYTTLINIQQSADYAQTVFDSYVLYSPDGFFEVDAKSDGNTIELILDSTISFDAQYDFNGGLAMKAVVDFREEDLSTKVTLDLSAQASDRFSMSLSEDHCYLTVKVYQNVMTSIEAERKNGTDTLVFTGTGTLNMEILDNMGSEDTIILRFDGMLDTLTDSNWVDTLGGAIQSVVRVPLNTSQTQILVQKKSGCEYYIAQSGDRVSLSVTDTNAISYSVKIPYMPGTNVGDIVDVDDYWNNRFTITLPGDQRAYLQANPITNLSAAISETLVSLNAAGNTVITIKCSKLQAYKIHYTSDAVLLEVDDPRALYDKIVVLDAGHGGNDPGAQRNGVDEKDLNLTYIYTYVKDYFVGSDIKVYWTRTDDSAMSLNNRAAFTSKVGADFFISMHMNTFTTSAPNGLSVFYSTRNTATSGGMDSLDLANILQENLISGLGAYNRKVKTCSYVVCRSNTVPAVLIELGFLTNPTEFAKLTSTDYQQKTARILYDSIVQVFEEYPTGR